jgi:hypothetical protein
MKEFEINIEYPRMPDVKEPKKADEVLSEAMSLGLDGYMTISIESFRKMKEKWKEKESDMFQRSGLLDAGEKKLKEALKDYEKLVRLSVDQAFLSLEREKRELEKEREILRNDVNRFREGFTKVETVVHEEEREFFSGRNYRQWTSDVRWISKSACIDDIIVNDRLDQRKKYFDEIFKEYSVRDFRKLKKDMGS